jgi:hypothetical protein
LTKSRTSIESGLMQSISSYVANGTVTLSSQPRKTRVEYIDLGLKHKIPRFINEFWTAKQRQANPIHEVSYRACFKPQLPRMFIKLFTKQGDTVYDPFAGRGTTIIEAALLGRNVISNDINPLSKILTKPRLYIPDIKDLEIRLKDIETRNDLQAGLDLSMFFHVSTLYEILTMRQYLMEMKSKGEDDELDLWIRMVATNRLTGHSNGFFSVYTLPPNQAASSENQKKINRKRNQIPEYRNTRNIILSKARQLVNALTTNEIESLENIGKTVRFFENDAANTMGIEDECVHLTVTSPPFLDVVQYSADNWLRCWFNDIDTDEIGKKITMSRTLVDWCSSMKGVFKELYRITKPGGHVAFEVGEVKGGKVLLDAYVAKIGSECFFDCLGIVVNEQKFTKTSNIWGITNNSKGTNTNRIVMFEKA